MVFSSPLWGEAGVRGSARTLPLTQPSPEGAREPIVRGIKYGTFFSLSPLGRGPG
ncbi:Uncharacterised protein [Escherichia coli]|nr:Uncharacterised protein [Escherichia coli]